VPAERIIAVVEDDGAFRIAVLALIRSHGYEARGHDSAEAFFDSADLDSCDCIITDIRMPGLSGIDLARRLRAAGRNTPIIMITALPDAELKTRALAAGALCLLGKPFDASELLACLEQTLGR
jgi:FixJ family two-component response regulator